MIFHSVHVAEAIFRNENFSPHRTKYFKAPLFRHPNTPILPTYLPTFHPKPSDPEAP